ncbi:MAG: hypothetical protein ABIG44_07665 [Planctomycetota bacterium]
MGEYARVESVEALRHFRSALCKFTEVATVALDEAEADIQRTDSWIKHDQQGYWKGQLRQRTELHTRAKSDLSRKKMQKSALGERYSFVDELKALDRAQQRMEDARAKQAQVKHWSRMLDEEDFSYKGVAQGLRQALEIDIPRALAQLDNMMAALEAYVAAPPPPVEQALAGDVDERPELAPEYASMARPTPPDQVAPAIYQQLRARIPAPEVRDTIPVSAVDDAFPFAEGLDESSRTALARLELSAAATQPADRVILAADVWQYERIFLAHLPDSGATDNGWYIGPADDIDIDGYQACRVADMLNQRPGLEAVLALPVGYVVVLAGAKLEVVLDDRDKMLWPATRDRSPEPS